MWQWGVQASHPSLEQKTTALVQASSFSWHPLAASGCPFHYLKVIAQFWLDRAGCHSSPPPPQRIRRGRRDIQQHLAGRERRKCCQPCCFIVLLTTVMFVFLVYLLLTSTTHRVHSAQIKQKAPSVASKC